MADTKLSALTELAATPASNDEVYIRDVSEAASLESKRILIANLLGSLPATTLNGTLTLNGQVFDAGSDSAQINTTGTGKGLTITSTNDGADGALFHGFANSSSPVAGDVLLDLVATGKDSGGNDQFYGQFQLQIEDPTSGSEKGKLRIRLGTAFNVALTLSNDGNLWIDGQLDVDNNKIVNVTDPSSNQDAATKKYVDDNIGGLTVAETEVFNGAAPSGWADLDLSGTIGAQATLVLLKVKGDGSLYEIAVRKNGDTDNFQDTSDFSGTALVKAAGNTFRTVLVATDSAGVIEWVSSPQDTTTIDIIAYIK